MCCQSAEVLWNMKPSSVCRSSQVLAEIWCPCGQNITLNARSFYLAVVLCDSPGYWFVLRNIRYFTPIHITAPYISTNVSTPRAQWKVIKCEVLFWISSGSFWMKHNMPCKVKRVKCLIWSSFLFSTREEFLGLEKEDNGMS